MLRPSFVCAAQERCEQIQEELRQLAERADELAASRDSHALHVVHLRQGVLHAEHADLLSHALTPSARLVHGGIQPAERDFTGERLTVERDHRVFHKRTWPLSLVEDILGSSWSCFVKELEVFGS